MAEEVVKLRGHAQRGPEVRRVTVNKESTLAEQGKVALKRPEPIHIPSWVVEYWLRSKR